MTITTYGNMYKIGGAGVRSVVINAMLKRGLLEKRGDVIVMAEAKL